MPDALLEVRGLAKNFGALRASDGIDGELSVGRALGPVRPTVALRVLSFSVGSINVIRPSHIFPPSAGLVTRTFCPR